MSSSQIRQRRILLADDHAAVRAALTAILRQQGLEVVGEASDGRAAIAMCDALRPEVAVLDIEMPLLNGIDAAREIQRRQPGTKIVLVTMHTEVWYAQAALRAGATGYVHKRNAADNLVAAIHAVLRGATYISPARSPAGDVHQTSLRVSSLAEVLVETGQHD